ncbi:DUF2268 domain-containing protein [Viridibacillus sp. NPDC093762]|uniref:DUF2268 domain-containing protein n=1 Tax=Viridibacillus sp. NPDC093762 TaxID=3390720 RepID=UPI003CFF5152
MKRFISLVILTSLFLIGCTSENAQDIQIPNKENLTQKEVSFSHEGKTFKIIPFYGEYLEYAKYSKENPKESNKNVYSEKVLSSIKEKSSINFLLDYPFLPTNDLERIEENTNFLLKNQDKINECIKDALIKSAELLPGDDINIFILPIRKEDQFAVDKMQGVAGNTFSSNTIFLLIDSTYTEEMLRYTVAHEYHHTVNILLNADQAFYSLFDSTISEGKADSFAEIVYPNIKAPWTEPLPNETFEKVLIEVKNKIDSTSINDYNQLFNGDSTKGIPLWSNYKIGYEITQNYIKNNPEVPVPKWTGLLSKDLLRNSDYNEILN